MHLLIIYFSTYIRLILSFPHILIFASINKRYIVLIKVIGATV